MAWVVFVFPYFLIPYPLSLITDGAQNAKKQLENTSLNIKHETLNINNGTLNIKHETLNINNGTLNIRYGTLNINNRTFYIKTSESDE